VLQGVLGWRVSDCGPPCLASVCAAGDHGLLPGGALPGGLRLPPLPALPAGRSRCPHGPPHAQPHRLVHHPPETLRLHRNNPQVGRPPGPGATPTPVNSLCDRSACPRAAAVAPVLKCCNHVCLSERFSEQSAGRAPEHAVEDEFGNTGCLLLF
jgi:hypothetical protein